MLRTPRTVAVIGGGLAGLTAAYRLAASGLHRVTLIDSAPRLGGWVRSRRHRVAFVDEHGQRQEGTVTCEAGPRSIRPKGGVGAAKMLGLIHDVGLGDDVVPIPNSHPAAQNRYLLDTDTAALKRVGLGWNTPAPVKALIRGALLEPFRARGGAAAADVTDESVGSFFARRFGPDAAGVASAFVHGIYAADPDKLSLRSAFGILHAAEEKYGSVVLGMLLGARSKEDKAAEARAWAQLGPLGDERKGWSMYGLRGGIEGLTQALEVGAVRHGAVVRTHETVTRLDPQEHGVKITLKSGEALAAEHVVAALPPKHLDHLLPATSPLPHLNANPSTTVGVVNVVYPLPPSAVHPEGFGYLIPRSTSLVASNPEGALGVVFDSTALPGTDDGGLEGKVTKLTVMLGGPYWSSYSSGRVPIPNHDELRTLALTHLFKVFPRLATVNPLLVVPHLNTNCIPTYAPGHGGRLRELHEVITRDPLDDDSWAGKLSVIGAGYGGVSVNDCVLGAELVAQGLADGCKVTTGLERWSDWA